MGRAIRVLVCDDVADLRAILREVIDDEPAMEVVGEAENGRDCVRLVAELRPDVVLLDLSMPDMDGLETIPRVATAAPATGIVVFSGFVAERVRQLALNLGADGYVDKGTPLDELAAVVRDVAARASGGDSVQRDAGAEHRPPAAR